MNYKHLSKYHYIYRLYFDFRDDLIAHIEKLPIIYSNKQYIYISEPGNDELRRLTLNAPYGYSDIKTEVNDDVRKVIGACLEDILTQNTNPNRSRYFYFLIDDPELLNEFKNYTSVKEMRRLYLESKVKNLVANMKSQEEVVKKYHDRIDAVQAQISALDKEE